MIGFIQWRGLWVSCLAMLLCATTAGAQTADDASRIQPSQQISAPAKPAPTEALNAPPIDHLFGDWNGIQTGLGARGINVQLNAVTEFAGNVSGGTRQGATFANQIGFDNDINWERLAGLTGLSSHLIMVSRSGSSDSRVFGDNLLPVQEVYGSGGDVAVHLVSIYAQETLFEKRLDFAIGRMNVENDFASSPLYCAYMNNDLCGDPKALPGGDIGHSAYPDAVWAARLRVRPVSQTYLETGIYEVNQGLYNYANFRTGFKFDSSQDSGVYLPVEVAWEPVLGADSMPGHYKLGFGYDTSSGYQDFGNALAAAGVAGYANRVRNGNTQFWALADQMLLRNGTGDKSGIIALAGFIRNDPNNTAYARQYFAGLLDRGFWADRAEDGIGFLATYVSVSDRLAEVEGIEESLDLPLSNKATGIQSHEIVLEANYDIHVTHGLNVEPDFQYVIQPNAQANIRDATVFGFRAHVEF